MKPRYGNGCGSTMSNGSDVNGKAGSSSRISRRVSDQHSTGLLASLVYRDPPVLWDHQSLRVFTGYFGRWQGMFTCVWAQYGHCQQTTRACLTVYQPLRRTVASRPTLIRIYGHDDRGGASASGAILPPRFSVYRASIPIAKPETAAR
ncbi:Piso0_005466 [Millerozyma farinosa CBS 7064]|uniref:Piso0_005466 protein n=1 Tax=Pichia sorbitophila (strain ATCC MYA-4447 / BCRC 22081 / CBS 7064 / NBRC 10061 / NRRL Y-12695) TaxID=559304 RepID=G8Y563_PICSO|nr:Piso0_005466 [Millerozyma farinosa CBS 7064]